MFNPDYDECPICGSPQFDFTQEEDEHIYSEAVDIIIELHRRISVPVCHPAMQRKFNRKWKGTMLKDRVYRNHVQAAVRDRGVPIVGLRDGVIIARDYQDVDHAVERLIRNVYGNMARIDWLQHAWLSWEER